MSSRWTWVVLWACLIEGLILWPHPPDVPRVLAFTGSDKVVHATLFLVQAVLTARALDGGGRPWWPALVGVLAFAAGTEVQQSFIPSRSMELGDFVADSIGAIVGLMLVVLRAPRRRELHR